MLKKKTALITGAAGFIGSHTCDFFLKKGFIVKGIDNFSTGNKDNLKNLYKHKNFRFKKIDLLKLKNNNPFLKNVTHIVHFAGLGDIVPSINNPKKYIENNVIATLNLIDFYYKKKIKKFVYAASSSCYGIAKTPTDEKKKNRPSISICTFKVHGRGAMYALAQSL